MLFTLFLIQNSTAAIFDETDERLWASIFNKLLKFIKKIWNKFNSIEEKLDKN